MKKSTDENRYLQQNVQKETPHNPSGRFKRDNAAKKMAMLRVMGHITLIADIQKVGIYVKQKNILGLFKTNSSLFLF